MSNVESTSPLKEGPGTAEPPAKLLGPAFSAFHSRYSVYQLRSQQGFCLNTSNYHSLFRIFVLTLFLGDSLALHFYERPPVLLLVITPINTPLNELHEAIL
jgi:hypothetical protein